MADPASPIIRAWVDLLLKPDAPSGEVEAACRAHGLRDADEAARLMREIARAPASPADVRAALLHIASTVAASASPPSALAAIHRFVVASAQPGEWVALVAQASRAADALAAIGIASPFLSDILLDAPATLSELLQPGALERPRSPNERSESLRRELGPAEGDAARKTLREFKRHDLLWIALRDLLGIAGFEETVSALSDLACVTLQAALRLCESEFRARYGTPRGTEGEARSAVIALGKLGGHELNYSSDIDLMFIHSEDGQCEPPPRPMPGARPLTNQEYFDRLAAELIRYMQEPTGDGIVFRVDARLRPEGASGRLSRSLAGCLAYYESWAEPWERQALIKASYAAGDEPLATRFISSVRPFVYGKRLDALGLADVRAMRERIEPGAQPRSEDEMDVKVGPGGIRDVEFATQALQLVAGPRDESVRSPNTLAALSALVAGAHIGAEAGDALRQSYVFLRTVEHRLQLIHDQPLRRLPSAPEDLDRLAHGLGHVSGEGLLADLRAHTAITRRIFDEVFERLTATAATGLEERLVAAPELPADEAHAILRAHGIGAPAEALETLRSLATGPAHAYLSTKAQRQFAHLVPRLLDAASQSADPDLCLCNLARFVSMLGSWNALYDLLDRSDVLVQMLCRVAGSSPFLSDILARHPEFLDALLDPDVMGAAKSPQQLQAEANERLSDADPLASLRRFKRRELLRIGVRQLMGYDDVFAVMAAISDLADAAVGALLRLCEDRLVLAHGHPIGAGGEPIGFAIIGLGKLGGRELHYSSDLDVMFIYGGEGDTDGPDPITSHQYSTRLAECILRGSGELTAEGRLFAMDARLRAEGAKGSIVMPVAGYVDYCYDRAQTWERLALTRARHVAGDAELTARLFAEVHPFVCADLTPRELDSLRQIKRRMERERARPNGPDQLDIKLGPGGISDIEFIVQKLQLEHGQRRPGICRPNTHAAIEALRDAGLLSRTDAAMLSRAYEFLRAVECAVQIAHEESAEVVDMREVELARLARRLSASGWRDLTPTSLRQRLDEERALVRALFDQLVGGNT